VTATAGGRVGARISRRPITPGKLKTWKPDTVHGVAERRDFSFSGFQVFTPSPAPEEGVRAASLVDNQAVFFIELLVWTELLIWTAAVAAAS